MPRPVLGVAEPDGGRLHHRLVARYAAGHDAVQIGFDRGEIGEVRKRPGVRLQELVGKGLEPNLGDRLAPFLDEQDQQALDRGQGYAEPGARGVQGRLLRRIEAPGHAARHVDVEHQGVEAGLARAGLDPLSRTPARGLLGQGRPLRLRQECRFAGSHLFLVTDLDVQPGIPEIVEQARIPGGAEPRVDIVLGIHIVGAVRIADVRVGDRDRRRGRVGCLGDDRLGAEFERLGLVGSCRCRGLADGLFARGVLGGRVLGGRVLGGCLLGRFPGHFHEGGGRIRNRVADDAVRHRRRLYLRLWLWLRTRPRFRLGRRFLVEGRGQRRADVERDLLLRLGTVGRTVGFVGHVAVPLGFRLTGIVLAGVVLAPVLIDDLRLDSVPVSGLLFGGFGRCGFRLHRLGRHRVAIDHRRRGDVVGRRHIGRVRRLRLRGGILRHCRDDIFSVAVAGRAVGLDRLGIR